jgi:hypothetical protein
MRRPTSSGGGHRKVLAAARYLIKSQDNSMPNIRITPVAVVIVGILSASHAALAQSSTAMPPHVPLQKAIGQSKTEIVASLIVLKMRGEPAFKATNWY